MTTQTAQPNQDLSFSEWVSTNFNPFGPVNTQKEPDAIDLDYDALYAAGIPQDAIVAAVADHFNIPLSDIEEQNVDPGNFLYAFTNAAKPGTINAFTDGLIRGVLETGAPMVAGAFAAGTTAAKSPLPPQIKGPLIPLASLFGAIGATNTFGEPLVSAAERFQILDKQGTRLPQNRFAEAAGKSMGSGGPFIFGSKFIGDSTKDFGGFLLSENMRKAAQLYPPLLLPGKAVDFLGKTAQQVGRSARDDRRKFVTSETAMLTGAGVGAGFGDTLSQGDPMSVAGGELAGGFIITKTPAGILLNNIGTITNKFRNYGETTARQTAFGLKLQKLLRDTGRDPNEIANTIEAQIGPDGKLPAFARELLDGEEMPSLTVAGLTDDPIFGMLENYAKQANSGTSKLDLKLMDAYEEQVNFYMRLVGALREEGDPASLVLAQQIREDLYKDMISRQLTTANEQARNAAAALGSNDFSIVGRGIKVRIDGLVESILKQEQNLWNATPTVDIPFKELDNLKENIGNIQEEFFLTTQDFPSNVRQALAAFEVKSGRNLITSDSKEVIAAQRALDNLPPLTEKAYERIVGITKNPEDLRIRGISQLDDGPFVRPSQDYQVLDYIAQRRRAGDKSEDLKLAERAANARIRRSKAMTENQRQISKPEEEFESPESITTKDTKKLRTTINDEIRRLEKDGLYGQSKPLRELKEAIDDLEGIVLGSDDSYQRARAFTRAKKSAFNRTFAGDLLEKTKEGGLRVREELIPDFLMGGSINARTMKFRDLEDTKTFIQDQIEELDIPPELQISDEEIFGEASQQGLSQSLFQAVSYAARHPSYGVLDANGRIVPEAAQKFIQENDDILQLYPQLREMLENGRQFETAVKMLNDPGVVAKFKKETQQRKLVSRLITDDNPTLAFGEAVSNTTNPSKLTEGLIDSVLRANTNDEVVKMLRAEGLEPEDAVKGLKSVFLDLVQVEGGLHADGIPDFRAARQFMFGPMIKGRATPGQRFAEVGSAAKGEIPGVGGAGPRVANRESLATLLKRKGVFNEAELDRLEYVLKQGEKLQTATATSLKDVVQDMPGLLTRAVAKIAGSTFATTAARFAGLRPQGIVEANVGAAAADSFLNSIPGAANANLLEQAVLDPKLMVLLLRETKTEAQAKAATKALKNYLINAGITVAFEEEPTGEADEAIIQQGRDAAKGGVSKQRDFLIDNLDDFTIGPVSMAPPPPRVSTPAPLSARNPSAGILAQAPANPNLRTQMAAAFPGDGITSLLAARRT
jgi:hypothetical protein